MDGAIVICLSLMLYAVCYFKKDGVTENSSQIAVERVVENTALNPEMIHDEHAFMGIANELGFH